MRDVNEAIEVDESSFSTPIFDLGFDSLDHASILLAVEEEFGVKIPDEAAQSLISVDVIVVFLEAQRPSL